MRFNFPLQCYLLENCCFLTMCTSCFKQFFKILIGKLHKLYLTWSKTNPSSLSRSLERLDSDLLDSFENQLWSNKYEVSFSTGLSLLSSSKKNISDSSVFDDLAWSAKILKHVDLIIDFWPWSWMFFFFYNWGTVE
jgi:hypothetical protein